MDFKETLGNIINVNYCPQCKKYLKGDKMERYLKRAALFEYNSRYNTNRILRDIQKLEIIKK
jgi:hypothetical protein